MGTIEATAKKNPFKAFAFQAPKAVTKVESPPANDPLVQRPEALRCVGNLLIDYMFVPPPTKVELPCNARG